ncbi:ATP-binding protein [Haliea sp. E1-2-M8]|uniref:ATP-binding protein n=1 Tax=Haliea sp. E1-2-M8 TaxID=3064706 RepID=UPI002724459F|nr:ATP-binding protein [Haliea sp. E1-2-M8]MDO8862290.1 ATP-binding protein [Haliea sp. E1-2-M8]
MSLRRQLIMVSLLLLTLPWAGCQFLREMEGALREGQGRALAATADAIAASLSDQPRLLYPHPERLRSADNLEGSIYAPALELDPVLDGYEDGWPEAIQGTFENLDIRVPSLHYRAGVRGGTLYLMLQIRDDSVTYHDPGLSPEPNGDRLMLVTWLDGRRQEYVIATPAPGSVAGQYAGRRHPGAEATRIRGYWQDTAEGYAIELALPLALTGGRLGLYAIDVASHRSRGWRTAGNTGPLLQAAPPWLIYPPAELAAQLARFAGGGQRLLVTDRHARLLTTVAATSDPGDAAAPTTFWLLRALYRRILADPALETQPEPALTGTVSGEEISGALRGYPEQRWYRTNTPGRRTLSVAAPIRERGTVIGTVVVQQGSEQYLSLTDRAFSRLLGYSLLVLGVAALGLLGFASLLSWRIRKLSRAADRVLGSQGMELAHFPRSRARDEIGDLSRSYARLLDELHDYNEYLRTLSRKLSHELRTPIAVIQSSLDNLGSVQDNSGDSVYVSRAREGLERLSHILNAMTEASRLEESIGQREHIVLDLVPLVQEVCAAYRGIYPDHRLVLHCPPGPAPVRGAADLLVQALDKLVDNAASFAPTGSDIVVSLTPRDRSWALAVSNTGPPLPGDMQGRLFEAMVSLRQRTAAESVHLGLGLYVVKLVADYHHGSVQAENRDDGKGAVFTLVLPAAS